MFRQTNLKTLDWLSSISLAYNILVLLLLVCLLLLCLIPPFSSYHNQLLARFLQQLQRHRIVRLIGITGFVFDLLYVFMAGVPLVSLVLLGATSSKMTRTIPLLKRRGGVHSSWVKKVTWCYRSLFDYVGHWESYWFTLDLFVWGLYDLLDSIILFLIINMRFLIRWWVYQRAFYIFGAFLKAFIILRNVFP